MALLSRKRNGDPITLAEKELLDLTNRRGALEQKLAEASVAVEAATNARRQSLLDADLSDEAASARRDAEVRIAVDRHAAIADALQALATKIADAEARLGELRDRAEREQIAAQVRQAADALAQAREEFNEVAAKLVGTMQAVVSKTPTAPDLLPRISGLILSELPGALGELVTNARSFVLRVESGFEQIRRPVPPPPPELPAPPVERMRIYTLAALSWVERERVMTAAKYTYANPPRELATLAIGRNLADPPDSPRAKNLIDSFGLMHGPAHAADCIALDALDQPTPPQRPSLPEGMIERIGEPRQILIDAGRRT